jgi:carbamoyltransferase
MIILGINPGIDSTAALLVNGQVGAAVGEERLSRVKMHLGFPRRAIQEVLRICRIRPDEIDFVTFAFKDYLTAHPFITRLLLREKGCPFDPENALKPSELLRSITSTVKFSDLLDLCLENFSERHYPQNVGLYIEELRNLGIRVDSLIPVDHHTAHAASAYYGSGFDHCLVVTADGCGDGKSLTIGIGKDGKIKPLYHSPSAVSAGVFYASVTAFLGFRAHRHEGKITGLAAYGDPDTCYDRIAPCLSLSPDGRFLTCELTNSSFIHKASQLKKLFYHGYFRNPMMNLYNDYYQEHLRSFSREDIAAAAQKRLEDVFLQLLQPVVKETGLKKLALAGGVFSNVKLNQKLSELEGVDEIFIHPDMGDGGNALGGAFLGYLKHMSQKETLALSEFEIRDVYLGPEYSNAEVEGELKRRGLRYRPCENIEAVVADQLAKAKVVGRFNGRMEYGPRALGNRSILASPKDATINTVLNRRLHRTEFMPFAPSVLAEDAKSYFRLKDGNLHAAEFMTITCAIHPDKRELIPAVCHVDGTARPNLVHPFVNPSFHRIIQEFKQRTGLSVIVNTSFNIHEEPIVCTPADACIAFQQGAIDTLAIGPFVVER